LRKEGLVWLMMGQWYVF